MSYTDLFSLSLPPPPIVPGSGQNWMEVAYGTRAGKVRVVVRHPENIGQAPQIFQTYSVHTCPIMRVVLGEKHLISGIMHKGSIAFIIIPHSQKYSHGENFTFFFCPHPPAPVLMIA